mmetsp:Transcript_119198/g.297367  ORF Transcript_119198/g.297367 Transcript_119198/m.297367 type:complete len:211 (-) Transcript_119198:474-1106(-)
MDVNAQKQIGSKTRLLRYSLCIRCQTAESPDCQVFSIPLCELRQRALHLGREQVLRALEINAVAPHLDLADAAHKESIGHFARLPNVHVAPPQRAKCMTFGLSHKNPVDVYPVFSCPTHREEVHVCFSREPAPWYLEDPRHTIAHHPKQQGPRGQRVSILVGRHLHVDTVLAVVIEEVEDSTAPTARPFESDAGRKRELGAQLCRKANLP